MQGGAENLKGSFEEQYAIKEVQEMSVAILKRIYSSFSMQHFETLMVMLERLFTCSFKKVIVNEQ